MRTTAAVAAGNADTAAAAASVLRAGGNAVDAVVAAGFASAVTEPGLSSLGGGGFLLFYAQDRTRLRAAMRHAGLEEVRIRFDFEGTKVLFS